MPKPVNPICLTCALLSTAVARLLHGPDGVGSNCWDGDRCHRRLSDYRRRDRRKNLYRRKRAEQLEVKLPSRAVAFLSLYGLQQSRLATVQAVSNSYPNNLQVE